MKAYGDMRYFLEVERIVLDEHLKAALERTAGLRSRAINNRDLAAIEQVRALEKTVALFRRRLNNFPR